MKFYNKAQTLKKLKCKNAIIPKLTIIESKDYFQKKERTINKIINYFNKKSLLIIRSSSFDEDSYKKSYAGKFESVLNVPNETQKIASNK